MACPFFYPAEKSATIGWAFPSRLPLGTGHCGTCRAAAEEAQPTDHELREFCNLGYSAGCSKLPPVRRADCLRFVVLRDSEGKIVLDYIYEREHVPVERGQLEYDWQTQCWPSKLADACAQRQAECYLAAYLERRRR